MRLQVLAVTGMAIEARIAREPGVLTLAGGGDAAALARGIEAAVANGVTAIMSFGIAGALDPALRPGTCIVAQAIVHNGICWPVDATWSDAIVRRLGITALRADIAGVDRVITRVEDKRSLFKTLGAVAVDMESHVAARLAAAHRLPFAAFRVVSDPAWRSLPPAAAIALRADGHVDVPGVLGSLLKHPGQLPVLARAALDAQSALRALRRGRRLLGAGLGFGDLDKLALDVL
jgi:adenosylhomocysteine nucleosidase